jgi:hypothetical protein
MIDKTMLREQKQRNNVNEVSIGEVRNVQILKKDDKEYVLIFLLTLVYRVETMEGRRSI